MLTPLGPGGIVGVSEVLEYVKNFKWFNRILFLCVVRLEGTV